MPQSSCFRKALRNQCVYGSQTLTKFARRNLYPNSSLIRDRLSQKMSLFVRFEILELGGRTLIADDRYSRHNWHKFKQQVQTLLF